MWNWDKFDCTTLDTISKEKTHTLDTVTINNVLDTVTSWVKKAISLIIIYSDLIKEKWFLEVLKNPEFIKSLDSAWISPNNITTLRIVIFLSWISLYYSWNKVLWLSLISWSCWLDWLDWALARSRDKCSKEWELFDAIVDKFSVALILAMWSIEMNKSAETFSVKEILSMYVTGISTLIAAQLYRSQKRPWRPWLDKQMKTTTVCMFKSETIKFIKHITSWAANKFWKFKTWFQFGAGLAILWTPEIIKIIDSCVEKFPELIEISKMWLSENAIYTICLTLLSKSIILWELSISWGTKKINS